MTNFVLEVSELLLSLAKAGVSGQAQQGVTIAGILVQIVQKAMKAYQDHTGKRYLTDFSLRPSAIVEAPSGL